MNGDDDQVDWVAVVLALALGVLLVVTVFLWLDSMGW